MECGSWVNRSAELSTAAENQVTAGAPVRKVTPCRIAIPADTQASRHHRREAFQLMFRRIQSATAVVRDAMGAFQRKYQGSIDD
jgi:hypothetical protein